MPKAQFSFNVGWMYNDNDGECISLNRPHACINTVLSLSICSK